MATRRFGKHIGPAVALILAIGLPSGARAAQATAPSASAPVGPTASARIKTKCAAMSGDEKSACERDIRSDAQRAHAHTNKRHARSTGHAASAAS